jgi:hypothetical protein
VCPLPMLRKHGVSLLQICLYKQSMRLHGWQLVHAYVHAQCTEGHGIFKQQLGVHHVPVNVLQPRLLHSLAVMRPFGAG